MNHSNKMEYYPVSPALNKRAGQLTRTYFTNVTSPLPKKHLKTMIRKYVMCDSGGLQAFRALLAGKIIFFGSMVKTRLDDPDLFMLGIPCQCKEYKRRGSAIAMCIDVPTCEDDSDYTYYWKLAQSRRARDQMIRLKECLCPETNLGIVLQPRSPSEIAHYYCHIQSPSVKIYGYPIRNFRNKPKHALGNAFVLSFLCDMGVEHVHFLGSNAPVIIFLLAQAVASNMFKSVSFDSRTWDQAALTGCRYLHPETLSTIPTAKKEQLHEKTNLRTELAKFPGLFETTLGKFDAPDHVSAKEWIEILNIRIIEEFKNLILSLAVDGQLEKYVKHFNKYGVRSNKKIIDAMRLLDESKDHGHKYIEKKYKTKVKELYC